MQLPAVQSPRWTIVPTALYIAACMGLAIPTSFSQVVSIATLDEALCMRSAAAYLDDCAIAVPDLAVQRTFGASATCSVTVAYDAAIVAI